MESIGVIPEPAAIRTWWPGRVRSGVKAPVGAITSTVSPGRTSLTSQEENRPPGTTRTPMRGCAPAGEQMEYERRSSRPLDLAAEGERLAGPVGELLGEVLGDVEADGGGVLAEWLDGGDPQGVEGRAAAPGGRGWWGRGGHWSTVLSTGGSWALTASGCWGLSASGRRGLAIRSP